MSWRRPTTTCWRTVTNWSTRGCRRRACPGTKSPNWSRPGGQCRHNLGYWDGGQWWGAGPGAHGYVGTTRWWNVKHPNAYAERLNAAALPVAGFEQLGSEALHTEDVLLKIRLRQGFPVDLLNSAERERAQGVVADGLLVRDGDRLVLTPRGRLLADGVVRTLLG